MQAAQRRVVHDAMVRLAEGDRSAFETVFSGLWPEVLAFARGAVPAGADAEDLAQQTLLKIFVRISDFDTARDGVAWAFGIAMYEVKTLRRQRQRRREVSAENAGEPPGPTPSPEDLAIDADVGRALRDALGELSDADRSVLRPEAAAPALVSAAAWRKRRQRAVDRLRAVWRNRHA